MEKYRANLLMCAGTGCVASGTPKVKAALQAELEKRGLADEIKIVLTGCNGFCAEGPVMLVYPEEIFYQKLTVEEIPKLVSSLATTALVVVSETTDGTNIDERTRP